MNRLRNLEKRAAALMPPEPWTFSQFATAWAGMDALSRSLYQTMAATPELFPGDDCKRIRSYLERLGMDVEPEAFDIGELKGDSHEVH